MMKCCMCGDEISRRISNLRRTHKVTKDAKERIDSIVDEVEE